MSKKNGFTLMELLAVVVLLGLLAVFIVSKINSSISDSKDATYYASSNSLIKNLENYYFEQKMKGNFNGCEYNFTTLENTCVGFSFGGGVPSDGIIALSADGVISGNITFEDEYTYEIENNAINRFSDNDLYIGTEYVFDYSGSKATFTVPYKGYYKLEVWGAQGGTTYGGKGGYSTGIIKLDLTDTLYVYVGQQGDNGFTTNAFNGGGAGYGKNASAIDNDSNSNRGGGGGATDIRINDESLYARVIVAGGGGGGFNWTSGPYNGSHGGGLTGVLATTYGNPENLSIQQGTQVAVGQTCYSDNATGGFGYGGGAIATTTSGGGGGWYGGGACNPGAGGSGWVYTQGSFDDWETDNFSDASKYILTEKYILSSTQLIDGNSSMPSPTSSSEIIGNTGNGYAKITYLGYKQPDSESFNYTRNFAYKNGEYVFTAPYSGYYKLEVWGAQGGNATYNNTTLSGGYGGYSTGVIFMSENDNLNVVVGGMGQSVTSNTVYSDDFGYNGGGYGGVLSGNSSHGGGGGATHISTSPGLLYQLESDKSSVIIVAGGGGGASIHSTNYNDFSGKGGSGGGYIGGTASPMSNKCFNYGTGGKQDMVGSYIKCSVSGIDHGYYSADIVTNNASFGLGANYSSLSFNTQRVYGGGGGGYYGGGSGYHNAGGGGSGYIGNKKLSNKSMFCYDCLISNDTDTLTYSTSNVSEEAISGYAKMGNGYAKITYLGQTNVNNVTTN